MDRERLYKNLDEDEDLTDSERRDIYRSEIDGEEAEREWQDN